MSFYYCCTHDNNDCINKENCMRYLSAESEPHTTLYKYACTEDNNYLLYINKEENKTNDTEENNNEEETTD